VAVHPLVVRSVLVQRPDLLDYQVRQTARGIAVDVVALRGLNCAVLGSELRDSLGRSVRRRSDGAGGVRPASRRSDRQSAPVPAGGLNHTAGRPVDGRPRRGRTAHYGGGDIRSHAREGTGEPARF